MQYCIIALCHEITANTNDAHHQNFCALSAEILNFTQSNLLTTFFFKIKAETEQL